MVSVHYQGCQVVVVPLQRFIEDDPAKQKISVLMINYLPRIQIYLCKHHILWELLQGTLHS